MSSHISLLFYWKNVKSICLSCWPNLDYFRGCLHLTSKAVNSLSPNRSVVHIRGAFTLSPYPKQAFRSVCRMAKEINLCRLPQPNSRSFYFYTSVNNTFFVSCHEIGALTKAHFHFISSQRQIITGGKWNSQVNLHIQVMWYVALGIW